MKKILYLQVTMLALLLFGYGCSDDDPIDVSSSPDFVTLNSEISSLPGQTFRFIGTISDPAGIKSVNIKYDPWFLDKTIVKDSLPTTYELDYKFKVPGNETVNSVHQVTISVSNAGDVSESRTVTITLDKDITPPSISINSPADGSTYLLRNGAEFVIDVSVSDNKELASFKVESDFLNEDIQLSESTYNYNKEADLTTTGETSIVFTAVDNSGNTTTERVLVNILDELSFSNMFLTEETDANKLTEDLFGVPVIMEPSVEAGEEGYVFTGKYYSPTAGTAIRFIPQETSFQPYTFGADSENPGQLAFAESSNIDPILLPEKGYYQIKVNVSDLTYELTPYTPEDQVFDQVFIIGRGITTGDKTTCESNLDGSTVCWNFRSGKPFTQDPENPYRWTIEVELGDQPDDEGVNGFILNANPGGWSPFWRFDSGTNPRATVFNGGENFTYEEVDFGKYLFVFDTHLNQIKAIRI